MSMAPPGTTRVTGMVPHRDRPSLDWATRANKHIHKKDKPSKAAVSRKVSWKAEM